MLCNHNFYLISHNISNLDDITGHVVLHNTFCLLEGYTSGKKLEQVTRLKMQIELINIRAEAQLRYKFIYSNLDNRIRVPSFASRLYIHATLNQV